MFRVRHLLLLAVLTGVVCPVPVQATDSAVPAPDQVMQRFLDQMAINGVVHGQATVTRIFNPKYYAETQKNFKEKKLNLEAQDQTLVCRWAWDGDRELVEHQSGSLERHDAFLRMKEGTIFYTDTAGGKRRYTVDKSSTSMLSRPQSFYYRVGEGLWSTIGANGRAVSTQPAANGLVVLTIVDDTRYTPPATFQLTVEPQTGVLHGYKAILGSKLMHELSITSHHDLGTGRKFPASATHTFYRDEDTDWEYRQELTCSHVELSDPQSGEKALTLTIPTNSVIGDNLTGLSYVTSTDVNARDVLVHANRDSVVPLDIKEVKARGTEMPSGSRSTWLFPVMIGSTCAVFAVAVFSWLRKSLLDMRAIPD